MKQLLMVIAIGILSGCSLAPHYHRPALQQPVVYKEAGKWLQAKPSSATLPRGPWWQVYQDPVLNQLEEQVICANQDLKAALARYEQSRIEVNIAQADLYPTISSVANATRQSTSKDLANPLTISQFSDLIAAINLNYEIDVWGRVRNTIAAAKSTAQASAADLALINLSLHAALAADYFVLRAADATERVLDETVVAYQKALYLTRQRYKGGVVSVMDLDQAENQLETAKTLAADIRITRAQYEHAIAVLIGQPPARFSLAKTTHRDKLVIIAPELPSTLLERRPDIAEAEYLVQAANDKIGVARAAYFPAFNLASAIGYESNALSRLFRGSSLAWALGPTVSSALLNNGSMPEMTQVLFDGGRIRSLSALAWAQYCETVARYRQTVLTAYREVEDSLIALKQLDREYYTQRKASAAANRALAQAMFRYRGGLITYLDVVVTQDIALQTELSLINVHTRRQLASVQLIKALGGGWINQPG